MRAVEAAGFADLHSRLAEVARDVIGAGNGAAPIDWRVVVDAGWPGMEVPERLDGAGATFAEVAVVLQEFGRGAVHSAYGAVAGPAIGALRLVEPDRLSDEFLRETGVGARMPILVSSARSTACEIFDFNGRNLSGSVDFVPSASRADCFLIPAYITNDRLALAVVDLPHPRVRIERHPVVDTSQELCRVVVNDVVVPESGCLPFRENGRKPLCRIIDRAATTVAVDSLGLAEAMLDATVAHVTDRVQFGRPIGSFQAVQHACADMLVEIAVARRLVGAAVQAVAAGVDDATAQVSMAKSFTSDMAVSVAGKAMQLHGGMGYTWESGIHRYLKRATLDRALFGSPAEHRRRIARRYSDTGAR